jgi:hypothetical protein
MFQNVTTLHSFLRNIVECTKLGGYFIGTSYDGKTIFNKLNKIIQGESIDIYEKGKKIWQIKKEYSSNTFLDDETCVGYKIDVYQESINQLIPEYLVNYEYLNRIMEDYGFIKISSEESKKIGLPESSGMFIELYNLMMNEINRIPSRKNDYGEALYMNAYEKDISFLNRYFVYKKIRTVNAEKISQSFISQSLEQLQLEKVESIKAINYVKQANKEYKPKAKKLNKTLILIESDPIEEPIPIPKSELQIDVDQELETEPKQNIKSDNEAININLVEKKPIKTKKTSRKNKLIEFSIEE